MSIQEIERALATVPLEEVRRLRRLLDRRIAQAKGDHLAEAGRFKQRASVIGAAREHWKGGDGLVCQQQMREEWGSAGGVISGHSQSLRTTRASSR